MKKITLASILTLMVLIAAGLVAVFAFNPSAANHALNLQAQSNQLNNSGAGASTNATRATTIATTTITTANSTSVANSLSATGNSTGLLTSSPPTSSPTSAHGDDDGGGADS